MMPKLDGLGLVAALRADPRTAAIPVLLLSARAGQEASIEGCGPAPTTTWSSRSPPPTCSPGCGRTSNWPGCAPTTPGGAPRWSTRCREAFFVLDDLGAVIEINSAFTEILGYGPDGLPYLLQHPWWPDPRPNRRPTV